MSNLSKLKEVRENHPIFTLTSIAIAAVGLTWVVAEQVRINPLQDKVEELKEENEEYKAITKKYKLQSEFDSLVVYDGNKIYREGDRLTILGGQVSIRISSVISSDTISFSVDALSEDERQYIETDFNRGEVAVFKYQDNYYIINIKEYIEGDYSDKKGVKLSISKIKK